MLIAFIDEQKCENPPSPPFTKGGKSRVPLYKKGIEARPPAKRSEADGGIEGDFLDRIQSVFDVFLASGGEKLTY